MRARVRELISSERIHARVAELGAAITRDYRGRELVLVGVLRGCFVVMADIVRQIDLPLACEFLGIESYGDATETSGVVRVTSDLARPIAGKDVLIVEDIVDTGLTISYLQELLRDRSPKSLKICSLLHKPSRMKRPVHIDYLGFTVPDVFVVGYGLDAAQLYRNLPFIGVVEESKS